MAALLSDLPPVRPRPAINYFGHQPALPVTPLGRLLRRYRERAGVSQTQLGRLAGINPAMICRLESGNRRVAGDRTIYLIAAALDLSEWEEDRLRTAAGLAVGYAADATVLQLVAALRAATPEGQRIVRAMVEAALRAVKDSAKGEQL